MCSRVCEDGRVSTHIVKVGGVASFIKTVQVQHKRVLRITHASCVHL